MNSLVVILAICLEGTRICEVVPARWDTFLFSTEAQHAQQFEACARRAGAYVKRLDKRLAGTGLTTYIHPKSCQAATQERAA